MNLYSELKNRNVIRGAIAYAALAWLIIEVGSVVLPVFGAPEWILRGLIILAAAGFVPALVLFWRYEITPQGVMTESDAESAGTDSLFRGRRTDFAIMGVLGLTLSLVIAERLTLGDRRAIGQTVGLAVLPFDDQSSSKDAAYVAGGMYDELLSHLARIPDLRLISRTSMMRIAQAELTIPEMGRRLSVSHVLEGSLRIDGNRVRITMLLIDAAKDEHVWADSFERSLGDVFALQSDVALAIAAQLHRALSNEAIEAISQPPTTDARAYTLYLQAIDEIRSNRHGGDADVIVGLLEQALSIDPEFIQAKAFLADMLGRSSQRGSDGRALRLVTELRQRWPNHILAKRALGHYRYNVEDNYEGALEAYQAVVAELPNDIVAVVNVRNAYKRVNKRAEFLYWSQRAVELSPESQIVAHEHVLALEANQRLEEAMEFIEASVARFPDDRSWRIEAAQRKLMLLGDVDAYLEAGAKIRDSDEWAELESLSWIYYDRKDLDLTLKHLEARRGESYNWVSALADMDAALILRIEGRDEEAQQLAERAYNEMASGVDRALSYGVDGREYVLLAAQSAAIAGMTSQALRLQELIDQEPHPFFWYEARLQVERGYLNAFLGDPDTGWKQLEPWADDPFVHGFTRAFFKVSPREKLLFGDVPEFQAFIGHE